MNSITSYTSTSYISLKHRLFRFVVISFLLTQLLPMLQLVIPVKGDYIYAFFLASSIVLFPKILLRRSIVAMSVFLILAFLYHLAGNAFFYYIGSITGPLFYMMSGLLIAEYLLKYDSDYRFTRIIVVIVVLSNAVMSMISIPEIVAYPNILRYAFSAETKDNFSSLIPWLISFGTCHGLTFLFPALVFVCRKYFSKSKISFVIWLSFTILLFVIVYLSNATTAFVLSSLMVLLALFFKEEKLSRRMLVTIIIFGVLLTILMSSQVLIPILDFIQSNMDESWSNYHKIDDIKYGILYGEAEGDIGSRQELYRTSLALFLESPIIGTRTPELIAHHSWFIDRLACFGMFLIIPLVLVLLFNIKAQYRALRHAKVVYMLGVLSWMIMLFIKNDFGQGTWLYGFVYLPVLCRYADYVIENK